jgi:hypothetical protein
MISVSHSERAQMPVCSWRSEWHFRADIRILCLGRCSSPHPCCDPRNSARVDSVERQRRSSLLRSIIPSIALPIHLPICHSAFTLPSDQGAVPVLDPNGWVGPSPRPLLLFSNSFRAAPTLHGVSLNYLYSSTSRCVPFLPSPSLASHAPRGRMSAKPIRCVPFHTPLNPRTHHSTYPVSSQRVCRTPRSRIPRDP